MLRKDKAPLYQLRIQRCPSSYFDSFRSSVHHNSAVQPRLQRVVAWQKVSDKDDV
jgi:hypothetical protein